MIALNLHNAVLCGSARAAHAFERCSDFSQFLRGKTGDYGDGACSAPLAKDAHDTVVRDAWLAVVFHTARILQATCYTPPNVARHNAMKIALFCGAHAGRGDWYAAVAAETARALVERGIGIVYGGGRVGLMGVIADAALAQGGEVVGVIPRSLASEEIAHSGVTQLHVVGSMHERKALMADLSDAFIALPGGFGTMDEFCEILTWAQLGIHAKPIGLLNAGGYYDDLIALFDKMVREEFVMPHNRSLVRTAPSIEKLLELLL